MASVTKIKARMSKAVKAVKSTSGTKKSGIYKGKSNKLGYGGRAQQLVDQGVPGGVIGNAARRKGAAPGGPNYHGSSSKDK